MGKPCFSKIIKFFAIALFAAATAIAAIAALSSPAAADSHIRGGGGGYPLKSWDTDNLSAGGVGPKNYQIPYHDYSGYSSSGSHAACRSRVADAFFQTGGDTDAVNDFPVADYGSESEAGTVATAGSRSSDFRRLKRT